MMMRAGQCARAADWYGTSMKLYLGAKEEKVTLIRGVILYLFVGADAPTILIYAPSIIDMHPQ